MKIYAIIPARSGSKGVANKNILPFSGHPLLSYSIQSAKDSMHISKVFCSTDSKDIAEIARKYGAEVPFLRPDSISQDLSTDLEFINHWIEFLKADKPDLIVLLRPTSPLRRKGLIDSAIEKFQKASDLDSMRSIIPAPRTPYKMWKIKSNQLEPVINDENLEEPYDLPRQLLPDIWMQAGSIDIIKTDVVIQQNSVSGKKIGFIEIDREDFCDIDSEEHLQDLELRIKNSIYPKPMLIE